MGIYIKGFKPQDGLYVIKDGMIRKYKGKGGTVRPYELVEVKEPHGRLIDADKLNIHDVSPVDGFCVMGVTEEDIELADTVIEAEGETE